MAEEEASKYQDFQTKGKCVCFEIIDVVHIDIKFMFSKYKKGEQQWNKKIQ